jgi:hypothetical protein
MKGAVASAERLATLILSESTFPQQFKKSGQTGHPE